MKAKVIEAFTGCVDGDRSTQKFPVGAVIEGNIANVAVLNGWAEEAGEKDEVTHPSRATKQPDTVAAVMDIGPTDRRRREAAEAAGNSSGQATEDDGGSSRQAPAAQTNDSKSSDQSSGDDAKTETE